MWVAKRELEKRSSPHTRRYFLEQVLKTVGDTLFSAYAEVFPMSEISADVLPTLLRIRGGISRAEGRVQAR